MDNAGEDDEATQAVAYNSFGHVHQARGDLDAAEERYRESMTMFDTIGDPVGTACAMHGLGNIAREQGDTVLARERLEAAGQAYRKHHAARNLDELAADFARLEEAERAVEAH